MLDGAWLFFFFLGGHGFLIAAVESLAPNLGSATDQRDMGICSLQFGPQSPTFSVSKSLGTIHPWSLRQEAS